MTDGLDLNAMFGAALGLSAPWRVVSVDFDPAEGQLDLRLDFPRGSRFGCPEPGCEQHACPVHDTIEKDWRHLDFFQHRAFLHARTPRVKCGVHGVHLVAVPWARPDSGFTLLFEAVLLTYAAQMPVAALARSAREHDTRIWRVLEHHVNAARAGLDFSDVRDVGMDETSARRGQDYVSIFMDLARRRVMFATEGRDAQTVGAFAADLAAHGGDPATQIDRVTCDMSQAFISGVAQHLSTPEPETDAPDADAAGPDAAETADPGPDAVETAVAATDVAETGYGAAAARAVPAKEGHSPQIVFDRYHVVAKANEAVDEVRRAEAKTRPELKRSRYAWLKREKNLTAGQREKLAWLTRPSMQLKTARAARWRDDFNEFYEQTSKADAEAYLTRWCKGAMRSRLEPVKTFVKTVRAHWDGILAWQENQISNGLLEGTNSLVQAAKRRARGYRNKQKMITVIYLIAGKLPLPEIHTI